MNAHKGHDCATLYHICQTIKSWLTPFSRLVNSFSFQLCDSSIYYQPILSVKVIVYIFKVVIICFLRVDIFV